MNRSTLSIDDVEAFDVLNNFTGLLQAFNLDKDDDLLDTVNDMRSDFYCRDCDNANDSCSCGDYGRYAIYDDEANFD